MAGAGGGSGEANVHAAWRMAVARRAAQAYAGNGQLAALAVAGSVGAGLADEFSDLELDCYWFSPPGEGDRTRPIDVLGGELEALWAYDPDDREWSEDFRLGELGVRVSNFLTATIEDFLDDVLLRADTTPLKHLRLAALQRCSPLLGTQLIGSWRVRAARYPDDLAVALVEQSLAPQVLSGWEAREALASRGDDLAIHDLLARTERAVLSALLALNRIYLPHPLIKWQRQLISGLQVSPQGLAERLQMLWAAGHAEALQQAQSLLGETALLAETHTGADLSPFHDALSQRRPAIGPPHH